MRIWIDDTQHEAQPGQSVASMLLALKLPSRTSISGQPRTPFCGMGICGECRVTIDGVAGELACLVPCREGLRIRTRE